MQNRSALIIEDDVQISDVVRLYMQKDEWHVDCAYNGKQFLDLFQKNAYNLLVLDLMMSDVKGEDILHMVRKKSQIPVIIITAKSREKDKVDLLYMGADDYILKPFSLKEFMARVHSVMRRYMVVEDGRNLLSFDNGRLVIDNDKCAVYLEGKKVELTVTELNLLNVLAKKPNYVFSRNDLVFFALNSRYAGDGRIIDAHIKNIRKKIELTPENPKYIVTVIGSGYKFAMERDMQ